MKGGGRHEGVQGPGGYGGYAWRRSTGVLCVEVGKLLPVRKNCSHRQQLPNPSTQHTHTQECCKGGDPSIIHDGWLGVTQYCVHPVGVLHLW